MTARAQVEAARRTSLAKPGGGNRRGDKKRTELERFAIKVRFDDETGCWRWTAGVDGYGYASFASSVSGKRAHRWAYVFFIGPVPEGLQLDHLCRVRDCVNPAHLEPVTLLVNIRRGEGLSETYRRRDVCGKGHEFTETNTRLRPDRGRRCRECDNHRRKKVA